MFFSIEIFYKTLYNWFHSDFEKIKTKGKRMKKKNVKNVILTMLMFGVMFLALYLMFKDSYKEILKQLSDTKLVGIILIFILGIAYGVIDGILLNMVIKNRYQKYSICQGIENLYYGIFFKGITMATGTKPAQVYLLTKQGVEAGAGMSGITVQYVVHKFTVMLYTFIMLIMQHSFLKNLYGGYFNYLYIACIVNVIMIFCLILACVSSKFHKFIFKILDLFLKKEKYNLRKEKIRDSLFMLKEEAELLIKKKSLVIKLVLVNFIKLTCWYIIPYIAFISVGETLIGESFIQIVAISAFMNLVVGVLPVPGGNGSSEFVYFLLFGAIFNRVSVGSTMILYRLATYFIPFVVGCIFAAGIKLLRHNYKKTEIYYEEN